MLWSDFVPQLSAGIRSLADPHQDLILVVAWSNEESCYVQFHSPDGSVWAEVASNKEFLPKDRRLTAESRELLRQAGWDRPRDTPNWSSLLSEDATSEDYLALAQRCVVGLRDVHRVESPSQLTYVAFTSVDGTAIELPELGIKRSENGSAGQER